MIKKSQSAIEFLILTSFVLFLLTIFFVVLNENISIKSGKALNKKVTDLAYQIQTEISLAHESADGYNRYFKVPLDIDGLDYDADIIGNMIYIKDTNNKYAISLPILNTTGTLIKGDNHIIKKQGMVYINP